MNQSIKAWMNEWISPSNQWLTSFIYLIHEWIMMVGRRLVTAKAHPTRKTREQKTRVFLQKVEHHSPYAEPKLEFWAKTRVFRLQKSTTWQTRNVRLSTFFSCRVGLSNVVDSSRHYNNNRKKEVSNFLLLSILFKQNYG